MKALKVCIGAAFVLLVGVSCASAQTAAQNQHFAFDQPAPDLATANGYTYSHYDDSLATGVAFLVAFCSGTASPYTCTVLIPAYTPGKHTVAIAALNVAGESPKSTAFPFTFVAAPAQPLNVRIVP